MKISYSFYLFFFTHYHHAFHCCLQGIVSVNLFYLCHAVTYLQDSVKNNRIGHFGSLSWILTSDNDMKRLVNLFFFNVWENKKKTVVHVNYDHYRIQYRIFFFLFNFLNSDLFASSANFDIIKIYTPSPFFFLDEIIFIKKKRIGILF